MKKLLVLTALLLSSTAINPANAWRVPYGLPWLPYGLPQLPYGVPHQPHGVPHQPKDDIIAQVLNYLSSNNEEGDKNDYWRKKETASMSMWLMAYG